MSENTQDGIDLDAIRARVEAATEGPWFVERVGDINDKTASIGCARWRGYVNTVEFGEDFDTAEFIAHSRTDVPGLLDAVAERDAEIERLRGKVDTQTIRVIAENARYRDANRRLGAVAALRKDAVAEWHVPACGSHIREDEFDQHECVPASDLDAALGSVSGAVEGAGHRGVEPDTVEGGVVCAECGWHLAGQDAHVGARTIEQNQREHDEHHATPVAGHERSVERPGAVRREREIEAFVQWLWDEGLMPKHTGGATIQPDWLLRHYLGDAPTSSAGHEQEVRADEVTAMAKAIHAGGVDALGKPNLLLALSLSVVETIGDVIADCGDNSPDVLASNIANRLDASIRDGLTARASESHEQEVRADGASLIAAERQRQVAEEGWTAENDAAQRGSLALAAATYALPETNRGPFKNAGSIAGRFDGSVPAHWPWAARYWKPTPADRVRELVKAGALIAAEIDRLTARASGSSAPVQAAEAVGGDDLTPPVDVERIRAAIRLVQPDHLTPVGARIIEQALGGDTDE